MPPKHKRTRQAAAAKKKAVSEEDTTNIIDRHEFLARFHRRCTPMECNTKSAKPNNDLEARVNTLEARVQQIDLSSSEPLNISDFAIETLKLVGSYLAAPSRALFAVAIDNLSQIERRAIVGNQWALLDFGEIEKSLAAKLTDDDLSAVLSCIDSERIRVKKLRLTNCTNITGVGLEPLRSSPRIVHIDLSLVPDHVSPLLDPEPPISQQFVLPILHTLVGRRLKVVEFPKSWRENEKEFQIEHDYSGQQNPYNRFLEMFDLMMNGGHGYRCKVCEDEIVCSFPEDGDGGREGTQAFVCYKCYSHVCSDCDDDDEVIEFCNKCERNYCGSCVDIGRCDECWSTFCFDCKALKLCNECDRFHCNRCTNEISCKQCSKSVLRCPCGGCYGENSSPAIAVAAETINECTYCHDSFCTDCINSGHLMICNFCTKLHCDDCAVREGLHECKGDMHSICKSCRLIHKRFKCRVCYQQVAPELLEENDRLSKENEELQQKLREFEEGMKPNDIDIVVSQASCSRKMAKMALKENGNDVVEAIMSLV